jgi:hypothetical protein
MLLGLSKAIEIRDAATPLTDVQTGSLAADRIYE